ncbi:tether containing UBX domain for GLUT4 isoform X2 [Cuculus canorus]|uniref:tether containing UBX domain for GLUT4 isoform X2 n=1 Tax=Cuculus canorus TaxID=55661 RepID=UPI0023AA9272|nr:tether containing UBX domain for GLUT4 isoform X2 [Cuculus canorus]
MGVQRAAERLSGAQISVLETEEDQGCAMLQTVPSLLDPRLDSPSPHQPCGEEQESSLPLPGNAIDLASEKILEEVCRKQGGSPGEYGLKFQRSVLDLSLQWRFARLPNNAKLEMVPVSSRAGIGNTVRIALQLDDGSRLQDTFLCQQTLWELLNHFENIRDTADPSWKQNPLKVRQGELMEQRGEFSPVCIYMRDEVSGKDALEKTTLKSLGLTGGSAIIRVVMKKCSSSGQEEAVGATVWCNEAAESLGSTEGAVDVPLPQANTFPKDLDHMDVAMSLKSCTDKQDSIRESHASLEEQWPSSELESTPFVPFSGDGQRLGDSSVAVPSLGLEMPSSKLPTTFSSPGGPSKPKKSKNSQEPQKEQEQHMEREPLVYHLDLLETPPAGPEELPDEFFEVTVDDVRKRLAQLQSERKRLEEAPLMTKSFKEAQLKEKLERYPKVVLRVHFPDRHVLQGFFRPTETVGVLRDFVRSHLANADLPFYLFIAPPRTILNDETLTLFEAKLFPTAVIHFGSKECRDCYLKSDLLSSPVSPSAADLLVARCLSTSLAPSASSSLESTIPSLSEPEGGSDKKADERPEPARVHDAPQVSRRAPGKMPKWLKLPGGKR